jgi:hypothetical protein
MLQRLRFLSIVAAAAVTVLPATVHANSSAPSSGDATANLEFRVVIPRVLTLQVGSASSVDVVEFNVGAANLGDSSKITGVNQTTLGTTVNARLFGNNGTVQFKVTTTGPMTMTNGGSDTIAFDQLEASSSQVGGLTLLSHPAFANSGDSAIVPVSGNSSNVVNAAADWTFKYLNTATKAAGSYGSDAGHNGRVLYTASNP